MAADPSQEHHDLAFRFSAVRAFIYEARDHLRAGDAVLAMEKVASLVILQNIAMAELERLTGVPFEALGMGWCPVGEGGAPPTMPAERA